MTYCGEYARERARKDLAELDDPVAVAATRKEILKRFLITEEAFERSLVALRERCERILYEVKTIPPIKYKFDL